MPIRKEGQSGNIMNLLILRKAVVFFSVAGLLLTAAQTRSLLTAPKDTEITVISSGPWNGRFAVNESGEGGIASLYSYTEKERYLRKSEQNDILFLQNGNLLPPEITPESLSSVLRPEINLIRYMGWDALHLSAEETLKFSEYSEKEEFRELLQAPVTSWNFRKNLVSEKGPSEKYRILKKAGIFIFVTGITDSEDTVRFSDESCSLLKHEIHRQTGADLFVIAGAEKTHSGLSECESQMYANAPEDGEDPVSLPWYKSYADPLPHRTLFLLNGSRNASFRTMRGAHVCVQAPGFICHVRLTFRNRKVIGVNSITLQVNHRNEPRSWIKPDPVLMKLFP